MVFSIPMLDILYQDDDCIAIDKTAGISSIPERDLSKDSVVSLLKRQLGATLFIVHRLDKEVSGVMLFAKSAKAHAYLNGEFLNRRVRKTYAALVHGVAREDRGVIEIPIRQFGSGRMGVDEAGGKPCRTEFQVRRRFDAFTLLHAYPITGRRHQIRVHLYHIGHPVVGDLRYGEKAAQKKYERLMLHSASIALRLPRGKETVIESAMTKAVEALMDEAAGGHSHEPISQ